jgi:DNA-binding transcriptional MerR regulator
MGKSPDAFRTISEVSDWLDTPAHVLRFWESKFTQIRPVKRAGGRRYYRPEDMALLGGIKTLLHEQGMTIKGVQKLLREQGVRHVSALGPQPLDDVGEVVDPAPAAPVRVIRAAPLPDIPAAARAPTDAPSPPADPTPDHAAAQPAPAAPAPQLPLDLAPAPRRRRALPDLPPEAAAEPGILSAILARDPAALTRKQARLAPVVARLAALRDRLRATL